MVDERSGKGVGARRCVDFIGKRELLY